MLNTLRENYYVDCDELTVFNWARALDGKLEYLRRDMKVGNGKDDVEAWRMFLNDYLENAGDSARQLNLSIATRNLTKAILDYLEEPQDSPMKGALLNDVDFARDAYDRLNKEITDNAKVSLNIYKNIESMSDAKKRTMNPKEMTVLQYLININNGKQSD